MAKTILLAAILALVGAQGEGESGKPPPKPQPVRHAVVVHVDNKMTETGDAAKVVVKKLFLKDLSQWPDGSEAKAYGRDDKSDAHIAFRNEVLGMSEAELARHWLKVKSMNGTTPPKEVDSDRLVLKYVAKNPSAFGICTLDSLKGVEGVRVLFEF